MSLIWSTSSSAYRGTGRTWGTGRWAAGVSSLWLTKKATDLVCFCYSFEATSKLHPLASWTSAMLSCFAGGLLVNPLCGEPLLAALGDSTKLAMATLIWFLLYYCPQDLAFQFSKMFPVRIMMYTIKGIYYPKKVVAGMKHAAHVLPGNFLALMVVACCKVSFFGSSRLCILLFSSLRVTDLVS